MHRVLRWVGGAAVTLLCVTLAAIAGTTGVLEGTVRDTKTGETLPGVNVLLPQLRIGAVTDPNGVFIIQNLRPGSYEVRLTHVGYRTKSIRDVNINPDVRTRLRVTLDQTEVQIDEVVVVQGRPLIQTDVTSTAFMVRSEDLRLLPITQPVDVLRFLPGVTMEGNIRGGKRTEVSYLVDGLPVQDMVRGGLTSTLPLSSVVGMSVYTGGFEAEYGNALSGVVNMVTRQGTDEHRLYLRGGSDNLFGVNQTSKWYDGEFSLAGPLVPEKVFYIAALSGHTSDGRWWQDFPDTIARPLEKNLNGFAKLDVNVSPKFRLGAQILYTGMEWNTYEYSWRYNLGGLPEEERASNRIALIASHTVSDRFFYTASLSRYFVRSRIGTGSKENVPMIPYQYDFFLMYIIDGYRSLWMDATQESYTLKFDATLTPWQDHLVRFGAELNLYDLNNDIVKFEPRLTYFGKPLVNEPQLDFSTAYQYGPRTGSVYVQDKMDLLKEGLLLTAGLRYDFLDARASRPAIDATVTGDTAVLVYGPTKQASLKQQVSPRIGFATPVLEKGYIFFNLGWYFQYPLFDYLYTGLDRVGLTQGVAAVTGNPDLEPERSSSWEVSFKYALPLDIVASAAYFQRESSNLTDTKTFVSGDSKVAGNFGFAEFVNVPYATSSGIEIVLAREKGEVVTGELSYTYMKAEGQTEDAYDGYYIAQYGLPPARRISPLSWDQRHTIKGRVAFDLPAQFNVMVVGQWHSGRPYTAYPTSTGFEPIDGGAFVQNNARMPEFFLLDLKVEKHFTLPFSAHSRLTFYVDVRNLTNQKNVSWMDSNGRIGGELSDPGGYDIGRRTRVGIQFTM